MSLQQYLENRWIRRHETSREEIAEQLKLAERDIAQSCVAGLAPEWRLAIAYNAALQLALAALHAEGYEPETQNKHQRAIECLEFTIGLDAADVDLLDRLRRKRHQNVYDVAGGVSDAEADEMHAVAKRLFRSVGEWLKNRHPELAPARGKRKR